MNSTLATLTNLLQAAADYARSDPARALGLVVDVVTIALWTAALLLLAIGLLL